MIQKLLNEIPTIRVKDSGYTQFCDFETETFYVQFDLDIHNKDVSDLTIYFNDDIYDFTEEEFEIIEEAIIQNLKIES